MDTAEAHAPKRKDLALIDGKYRVQGKNYCRILEDIEDNSHIPRKQRRHMYVGCPRKGQVLLLTGFEVQDLERNRLAEFLTDEEGMEAMKEQNRELWLKQQKEKEAAEAREKEGSVNFQKKPAAAKTTAKK